MQLCFRIFSAFGVVLGLMAIPVQGQSQLNQSEDVLERSSPDRDNALPEWAEPQGLNSTNGGHSLTRGPRDETRLTEGMDTKAVPPPPEEPIPVDGGVALLAAAGAGYAVRKLNEEEEDDDEPA